MTMSVTVIGGGPHGYEVASVLGANRVLDEKRIEDIQKWRGGHYVAGAVWPKVRREIVTKLSYRNEDSRAKPFERGNVLFPGTQISRDVHYGEHCHFLYNSVVSHGCRLGDFVTVCSGAVLCGEVTVEDDVFIGANATVIHGGITLGKGAAIGAGAVVTRDVPPWHTVKGNPAC